MDSRPFDRHIASFIALRDNRDNGGLIATIESSDKLKRSLAMLTLWQGIQKRSDHQKLVPLCEWLQKDAETAAQRFHSQGLKEDMVKSLNKEIKTGNLTKVVMLVDNAHQVKRDENEFSMAMNSYAACGQERDRIRKRLENDPHFGEDTGRHMATVISAILAGIIIAATMMMQLAG
jgi:eukaryotic-like serine/threonine-protein kinase